MSMATALAGMRDDCVCTLMRHYIEGSARYAALPPSGRDLIDRYAAELCARANAIAAGKTPARKRRLRARYRAALSGAVEEGWLTAYQAATLSAAAASL